MPRRLRLVVPNVPVHITQRGNNRQNCFFTEADYLVYLSMLCESAANAGCKIHAYALMSNHVHLLVSPGDTCGPGKLMKACGERYVQYVNRHYRRTGTLWQGRFRSCLVDTDKYFLVCQRYIELNPVRAGMVTHPAHYQWTSYRRHAHGVSSQLLTPHLTYESLGHEGADRESAYRSLFCEALPMKTIDRIRKATNGNYLFGSESFTTQIGTLLGRRVTPGMPGRNYLRKASSLQT